MAAGKHTDSNRDGLLRGHRAEIGYTWGCPCWNLGLRRLLIENGKVSVGIDMGNAAGNYVLLTHPRVQSDDHIFGELELVDCIKHALIR